VAKADGTRGTSTFIPAVGPDGTANAVVAAVLAGETYRGTAFVVDGWYATIYAPITGPTGAVSGMLFVGQKMESVPTLREAVLTTSIGEAGYVEILGGGGSDAGQYLMSRGEERDGEVVLDEPDADGQPYVRAMVDAATALEAGQLATVEYRRPGDGEEMVARVAYHQPWDWVVAVQVPAQELAQVRGALEDGQQSLLRTLVLAGLALALLGGFIAWLVARWLVRRFDRTMNGLHTAADGLRGAAGRLGRSSEDLTQVSARLSVDVDETSEQATSVSAASDELRASIAGIAQRASDAATVASEAVTSVQATTETMSRLDEASAAIGHVVDLINTIAEQTNLLALNATIEAARAGEAGKGFAVVATEVKQLASQTAKATDEVRAQVAGIQQGAQDAVSAMTTVTTIIEQVSVIASDIAVAVEEQITTAAAIAENIAVVAHAAASTREASEETRATASSMFDMAAELQDLVANLDRDEEGEADLPDGVADDAGVPVG
jgi:uncharacterized protein YoxC